MTFLQFPRLHKKIQMTSKATIALLANFPTLIPVPPSRLAPNPRRIAMVKTGVIPGVVHEPPAGIRLLHNSTVAASTTNTTASAAAAVETSTSHHLEADISIAATGEDNRGGRNGRKGQHDGSGTRKQSVAHAHSSGVDVGVGAKANASSVAAEAAKMVAGNGNENAKSPKETMYGTVRGSTSAADEDASPHWSSHANSSIRGEDTGHEHDGDVVHGRAKGERKGASAAGAASGGGKGDKNHREVDWKELTRNINLILKEEGKLSAKELTESFTGRFRKVNGDIYDFCWLVVR